MGYVTQLTPQAQADISDACRSVDDAASIVKVLRVFYNRRNV